MSKHDIEYVRRTHFSGKVDLTARGNVMRTYILISKNIIQMTAP